MLSCKNNNDKHFMMELDNIDNNFLREKIRQISEDREISPNSTRRVLNNG